MKRLSRLLFTLLLLIVFVTSLSSRTMLRQSFNSIQLYYNVLLDPPMRLPNSTLLEFAAFDYNEETDKENIRQLLHEQSYSDISLEVRKTLREWLLNKRFEPDIMLDLIDLVKFPIDRHYGNPNSAGRYDSCAVVGNSGILLKTEYGKLIDSHDFVIRLNNAWISGFESHVGSKTSLSFMNSNILHLCSLRTGCFCHNYGQKVPIIMYICQPRHFIDYKACNSSHEAPLLITDARLDNLCARIVKYYSAKLFVEETGKSLDEWGPAHDVAQFHYSSGMQAIMLALGICEKVSIFGFGKSAEASHHYHTNQKAELHLHDYAAEYAFYHDLVQRPQVIPFLSEKFKVPPVIVYH